MPVRTAEEGPEKAQPEAAEVPALKQDAGAKGRIVIAVAVTLIVVVAATWVVLAMAPAGGAAGTIQSTSISAKADAIVATAAQEQPAGFTLQSSQHPGSAMSDWVVLQQADGSEANVTVTVYPSAVASQAYFGSFVAGVKGLPGYTDVTSDLAAFQAYGRCYGYGEDVDGIGVVNGVCTKGNVFIYVHLVSSIPFPGLEDYLTSVMGAAYQSAT
jgi:hypothetical protein